MAVIRTTVPPPTGRAPATARTMTARTGSRQACQLVGDAVQGDARGRRLHPDAPATDDHPQDPHVPRSERNACADAGQDQVRGRATRDGQALDEDDERDAGDDPRDGDKRGHLDHLQEGQRTEGVEHLFVVDEPRQDEAEDDDQDADHDRRAEDRGTSARDGLGRPRGRDRRHAFDRTLPRCRSHQPLADMIASPGHRPQ